MFRILSIDGGGIKGAFAAAFLDQIQCGMPNHIADYFDLIAGTSTGGIIALGLGLRLPTSQISDLYAKEGNRIFPRERVPWWLRARGAKYSNLGLRAVLEENFGDKKLGEAKSRLMIPALEAHTGQVHIYKTAHDKRLRTDYKCSVVDVAMGTSAAPVFLPPHKSEMGVTFLDGGIWANNPVGVATAEAIGLLNIPSREIAALSVGTTDAPLGRLPSSFQWMKRAQYAVNVTMAAQSSGSLGLAKTLIGAENIFRWNPSLGQGLFQLDGCEDVEVLAGLGRAEGRRASTRLESRFFTQIADRFTPCYQLSAGGPSLDA
jgi:predicted acylesterase/phospholipase RssA